MGTVKKTYKILNSNVSPSAPFQVARILPDGKKVVKSMSDKATGLTAKEVEDYIKVNYPNINDGVDV